MKWSEFKNKVDEILEGKDPVIQFILIDYNPNKDYEGYVAVTILKNGQLGIEG